jgi:hypothetical protein
MKGACEQCAERNIWKEREYRVFEKVHNEELHILSSSLSINGTMKSNGINGARNVARILSETGPAIWSRTNFGPSGHYHS